MTFPADWCSRTSPPQFGTTITNVAVATMLTLACRPLGAFIFGRLADQFGRRPVLMLDIALYSLSVSRSPSPPISDPLFACAALRRGDGRGVGHLRLAVDGDHQAAGARFRLRPAAVGLSDRLSRSPRWSSAICIRSSAGAACSWSASSPALLILYIDVACRNRAFQPRRRHRSRRHNFHPARPWQGGAVRRLC